VKRSKRQVSPDGICSPRLVQRISIDPELNTARARAKQGLEDHSQGRLSAVHSRVEEADGGSDLPAENCADEQPAQISLHKSQRLVFYCKTLHFTDCCRTLSYGALRS
jgi:hypothetical protein